MRLLNFSTRKSMMVVLAKLRKSRLPFAINKPNNCRLMLFSRINGVASRMKYLLMNLSITTQRPEKSMGIRRSNHAADKHFKMAFHMLGLILAVSIRKVALSLRRQ